MKDNIKFEEFLEIEKRLEIRAGTITSVAEVEKSKKLLQLSVDFGDGDQRTVVTNIKDRLTHPQYLVGLTVPFVTNLEPSVIMGVRSEAMICPVTISGVFVWPSLTKGSVII